MSVWTRGYRLPQRSRASANEPMWYMTERVLICAPDRGSWEVERPKRRRGRREILSLVARGRRGRLCILLLVVSIMGIGRSDMQAAAGTAAQRAGASVTVNGRVALTALMSLSDGHLQHLAQALQLLATSDAAQSGDWERIKGPLDEVGKGHVEALHWFAVPDGSYWSVQEGRASGNLSTRAYFPRLLAGQTVLGDLVVSKATGASVTVVAVPVVRPDKTIVGVLGASVYLDKLSARLKEEMGLAEPLLFYSFDATPLVALHWDPGLIFVDPMALGEEVSRAFQTMLSREQGEITYRFRGTRRVLLYRKSPVTGWWYAFGIARRD